MNLFLGLQNQSVLIDLQRRKKKDIRMSRKALNLLVEAAIDLEQLIAPDMDSQSLSEEIVIEKYLHLRSLISAPTTYVFPDFSLPDNLVRLYDIRRADRGKAEMKLDNFCARGLFPFFFQYLPFRLLMYNRPFLSTASSWSSGCTNPGSFVMGLMPYIYHLT